MNTKTHAPAVIHRRALLRGAAATSLGSAVLSPLIARAQAGPPKRLLIIHRPCGTVAAQFHPQGATAGAATDFNLSPILSAFQSTRSDLVVLGQVNAPVTPDFQGDEHGAGNISMLSGHDPIPLPGTTLKADTQTICARAKTIDQILAETSPLLRGTSKVSIQLGADRASSSGLPSNKVMSYSGPGPAGALWPETRPDFALMNVFANFMATPGDPGAVARAREQGKSVFDKVARDITRLKALAPQSERARLDEHLNAMMQLDRQLQASALGVSSAGCNKPTLAPLPMAPAGTNGGGIQMEPSARQMFQIIKAAFQCDVTRVATFTFSNGTSGVPFNRILPNVVTAADGHHEQSHGSLATVLAAIDKWYCDRVNELLVDLKNTPDGAGSNMLDNTLVFFFSEIAEGQSHSPRNVPVTLHGGRALRLQGGRLLRYEGGRSTNDIWAAIATAFGVPMASFGAAGAGKGAVTNLFASA